MADVTVRRVAQSVVTIPEHIPYGDISQRVSIDSGEIKQGYKVRARLQVLDGANAIVKDVIVGVKFDELDPDTNNEIVGVMRLDFNSSPKYVAPVIP